MKKEKPEEISSLLLPILEKAAPKLLAIYTFIDKPYNKFNEMQTRCCDVCHLIQSMKNVLGEKKMSSIVKKNNDFQISYNLLDEVIEADKELKKMFVDFAKINDILNKGKTVA